jgi:hypothetical protein
MWSPVKLGKTKFSDPDARIYHWVNPGKTKTEPIAFNQLLGFRSGHLIQRPCWNQQAVKPGKTKVAGLGFLLRSS